MERAVLVGAPDRDLPKRLADEHLEELARLTDTAGCVCGLTAAVEPLHDARYSAEYRRDLARTVVRRALEQCS